MSTMTQTCSSSGNDKCSIDMRWLPKDCDGQIKMGFSIIANAFKSKVKSLEEDLMAANQDRSEQEEKLAAMQSRLAKLQREHLDATMLQERLTEVEEKLIEKTVQLETATAKFNKKEQELMCDNRRLAELLRQYKKKAIQLESFRRVVVDSIKQEEEEFDAMDIPGDSSKSYCCTSLGGHKELGGAGGALSGHSAANPSNGTDHTPPPLTGTSPQCDSQGRILFRHARCCLSVDQFTRFLENVRRLNARQCSIEEALVEAEKICGIEHNAIYEEFRSLLLRKTSGTGANATGVGGTSTSSPAAMLTLFGSPLSA